MSQALNKMIKARAGLILDHPFFGALALRLTFVEDPTCPTAWTDGKSLGFNPEFIMEQSLPITKTIIAHEVMHCASGHHVRRQNRDPEGWNIAGDHVINLVLKDAGFELGEGWLADHQFANMSTEHIYSLLPEDQKGGNGSGGGNGPGEVRDAPNSDSQAERTVEENEWKVATSQAARNAKMMGKLPGSLERFAGELVEPKVDWRETLRRFITDTAKNDYSWARPNRRYIAQGLYLPSLYSEEMGEIIVVVDTSGSIGAAELTQFASELSAIAEDVSPACIHVLYVDTRVAHSHEVRKDDLPLVLEPKGGGGTAFEPAFKWVADRELEPKCLVYLTDMHGSFPAEEPPYPTLWVSTSQVKDAPFGEVVELQV